MKKYLLVALLLAAFSVGAMAQREPSPKKCAISAGVLQGGGGLVGVDFEAMIGSHFSAQAGVGLLSFGVGVNYHFKPFINSSMVSLVYWHQGLGDSHTVGWVGPQYTYAGSFVYYMLLYNLSWGGDQSSAWSTPYSAPISIRVGYCFSF